MFALALLISAAAPQPHARATLDAGIVASPALDAGVAVVAPALPPSVPTPSVAEVSHLRREVVDLKARTALLERQIAQAEATTAQFEKLGKQIADLQNQLNAAEERRIEHERKAVEKYQRAEQAVAALGAAQQQLATGNTNVGGALTLAESTMTGAALNHLQAARAALANGDLASARIWLTLAVVEAQTGRR